MQAKGIVCLHDKIYTPQPSIPTFNYSFEGWAATSGVSGGNRKGRCAAKGDKRPKIAGNFLQDHTPVWEAVWADAVTAASVRKFFSVNGVGMK